MDQNKHSTLDIGDKRWLRLLITPSWMSLLVSACCALGLVIGVIFASNYQGTSYQQQVSEIRAQQINAQFSNDDAEFNGLEGNTFMDIAPLLVMWGVIGIVIYFFAVAIVQSLQHAAEFKTELGYVNASRDEMFRTALLHLGIRIVVAGLWLLFILLFFNQIVPYAVNSVLAASAIGLLSLEGLLYLLLATVSIIVGMYIYTILLRLLFLKPRIFSKALYLT